MSDLFITVEYGWTFRLPLFLIDKIWSDIQTLKDYFMENSILGIYHLLLACLNVL